MTGLAIALAIAAPATAGVIDRKHSVDERIAELRDRVEAARARESVLQRQIDAASAEIRGLEQQVGDVSQRLVPLEHELTLRELKLNRLNALFKIQSDRLAFLRAQFQIAAARLSERLVQAYKSETPDTLAVLLSARSFSAMLDTLEYVHTVAEYDRRIVDEVGVARHDVTIALGKTRRARAVVHQQAQIVAVRVHQVRVLRDDLLASKGRLEDVRSNRKADLDSLSASERADASEIDALQAVSASLAAKIQAAQAHSSVEPPSPPRA